MALDIDRAIGDVKPHVRPVAHEIADRWTMYNIWGLGGSQDHLLGLALDFMVYSSDGDSIRTQVGNEIAAYFVKNSDRLNVSYVIWRQRIWNPSRDPAGALWENWRHMEDRGDPTQNHMDHVHVSFLATGVYTPPTGTPSTGEPMPIVKLSETGPGKSVTNNKIVQLALRNEYGTVVVDGDWGPQTTSYYKRWQEHVGAAAQPWDGLPGRVSLPPLGARYGFTVDLGTGTTPPPTPEEPTVPTVGGTVKFYEVGPGTTNNYNKIVQKALNYEFGGVVIDGIWGNQTTGAYKKWQTKLGFTGSDADGAPGKTSMNALAAKYKFAVDYSQPAPSSGAEPAHNYTRTTYGGRTVNQRTKVMLQDAANKFGGPFSLTQGSYNAGGVAASAGTHDGGGVVDISVGNMTAARRSEAVQCLRRAGFAAWLRTPSQGFAYHIHACAIGDREMAPSAKNQVQAYFNGRDGLARNGADTNPPRPWPAWANKYNQ